MTKQEYYDRLIAHADAAFRISLDNLTGEQNTVLAFAWDMRAEALETAAELYASNFDVQTLETERRRAIEAERHSELAAEADITETIFHD